MIHLLNGIGWGLFLAILVGPLLFTIIQTSLEKGSKAGFTVSAGIWFSDLLFIISCYFGLTWLTAISQTENFELSLGITGSVILWVIGGGLFFSKPAPLSEDSQEASKKGASHFLTGFLINTINPFTVLFWIGIMTTSIEAKGLSQSESFFFLGGIMTTIVFTDSLKVIFAGRLKKWLTPKHVFLIRKVAGFSLMVFGVVLLYRVL